MSNDTKWSAAQQAWFQAETYRQHVLQQFPMAMCHIVRKERSVKIVCFNGDTKVAARVFSFPK